MSAILKASIRGKKEQYADYLLHNTKNEAIRIFAIRGTASPDNAHDSILEMGAYEVLSRSEKPFLQVVMNFNDNHDADDDEWENLVNRIEAKIGYQGQPFVGVMHKYKNKWHMHGTWGRYNLQTGKMMPIDHIALDLKEVSYQHAVEHEHEHLLKGQQIRRDKEIEDERLKEEARLADEKKKNDLKQQFSENAEDAAQKRFEKMKSFYASQEEDGIKHKL